MNITRFLHSRICVILVAVVCSAWALALASSGELPCPFGNGGLVASWGDFHLTGSVAAPLSGIACTLLIAFLLVNINNTYNLLRNITHLQATAFIILQMAAPALMASLCAPSVSALVVLLCMYLMFSTYTDFQSMTTVFLVFFILSLSAGFDVIFIGLMPVFLLACAQMRIFSLRSILASLMGIVTPWIILLGFGIVVPGDMGLPTLYNPATAPGGALLIPLILAASLSAFVLIAAWLQNLIKYLTYNAHSRAMLSMVTVLSLVTVIFAAIGYANLYACLPLVNMCAALQLAHLFAVVHTRPKSYIAILCIFLPFILLTIWTTALCI